MFEHDDAMSEACIVFYECRRLYGGKIKNNAHFMALFKCMMFSWFTDWAKYDSALRAAINQIEDPRSALVGPEGRVAVKLRDAGAELKSVLRIIFEAPKEVFEILRMDSTDFFTKAVELAGVPIDRAPTLEHELRTLLQ
jgi:hypothetical protein